MVNKNIVRMITRNAKRAAALNEIRKRNVIRRKFGL